MSIADLDVNRPAWQADAACRGMDVNLFHPPKGGTQTAPKVCATCPARTDCLEDALADPHRPGWWGGVSHRGRKKILRERRLASGAARSGPIAGTREQPIRHGTVAGYQAHHRRGVRPCEACKDAISRYYHIRRARRKAVES